MGATHRFQVFLALLRRWPEVEAGASFEPAPVADVLLGSVLMVTSEAGKRGVLGRGEGPGGGFRVFW